jgi:hypothetical protein
MSGLARLDAALKRDLSTNHLEILLNKYPDKEWLWEIVSDNPNLTWGIVKKFFTKSLNWCYISSHKNITWEIVRDNPAYPWCYSSIMSNPNITWDIVMDNPDIPWEIDSFGMNPNVTMEILRTKPGRYWKYCFDNQSLTWEMIWYISGGAKGLNDFYNMHRVSCHKSATWEIMQLYPECKWMPRIVSRNPNITWKIVQDNPGYKWDWDMLSSNMSITWDDIVNNPQCDWNYKSIATRSDITMEMLFATDILWDYDCVSHNPNVSPKDVGADGYWNDLVYNPNITWEDVVANCADVDVWGMLSCNKFNTHPKVIENINALYALKKESYVGLMSTVLNKDICGVIIEFI